MSDFQLRRGDLAASPSGVDPLSPEAMAAEAEREFQELLMSPSQRRREKNRRQRKVFVAIRVRPFLPHLVPLWGGVEPGFSTHHRAKRQVRGVKGSPK